MSESLPVHPATRKASIGAFFFVIGVGAVNALLLHRIDVAIGTCIVAAIILVGAAAGARGHIAWFVDIAVVLAGVAAQALSVYSTFAYPNEGPGVAILTVVAVNHLYLFLVALAATRPRQACVIVVSSVASLALALHVSPLNIPTSFRQIMIVTGWSFLVPSILIAVSYMRNRAAQYRAAQSEKTFINSIGHEMRTPLTTILGLSRLARESGAAGNTEAFLSEITAAGEHLQAVMETLFLISSYRSGSRRMTPESMDVDEFVSDLEQRVSRLVHDTGLTLSSESRSATGCTIVADRELMMQACTALAIARLRQAVAGDSMAVAATCLDEDS
ncbi:MAG: hypothetical protein KOO61_08040, partial [Spirochaetales bacterium]|nr:hypothetical protein [Spirochaetales bacterium]